MYVKRLITSKDSVLKY